MKVDGHCSNMSKVSVVWLFCPKNLRKLRLVSVKQKNEHRSNFGQLPSHTFALERIFHSHKCWTSKGPLDKWNSWEISKMKNLNLILPGMGTEHNLTSFCCSSTAVLMLSLNSRVLVKVRPQPEVFLRRDRGPYWLLFSAQTSLRPVPSLKRRVEYRPNLPSTRRSHPTGERPPGTTNSQLISPRQVCRSPSLG